MPLQIPTLGRGIFAFSAGPTFPLSVSANGRFLQNARGEPRQELIDAAWFLGIALDSSEIDNYISIRKGQGFTGATVMAIVNNGYNGGSFGPISAPANKAGAQPFTTTGDFSTYNPTYFAFIQSLVAKFYAAGMTVLLYPAYWGFAGGNQGWFTEIGNNSQANCQAYGAYLGSLLKAYPNIILGLGGDFRTSTGTTLTKYLALINAMRSQGGYSGKWLASSEWNNPDDLGTAQPGLTYGPNPATSDQQINSFYGFGASTGPAASNGFTYVTARAAWADTAPSSPIPAGPCEPPYSEEANLSGISGARESIRKYHGWMALNGAFGFRQWGGKYIWWLNTAGPDPLWTTKVLEDPSLDICRMKAFLESFEWWKHTPSGTASGFCGRDLIVSGAGSGDSTLAASIDTVTPGKTLAVFIPSTGTGTTGFQLDLRSMSGPSNGEWINPTTGVSTVVAGGPFANTATNQAFTTPGNNGSGTNDWFMILRV